MSLLPSMARALLLLAAAIALLGLPDASVAGASAPKVSDPLATAAPEIKVYKTPTCGCCVKWVDHLEASGFRVSVQDVTDLGPIKARAGVPRAVAACHTAFVGDYVVEGHVPASTVKRLLREKPDARGVAVPGMPMGSPGMEGPRSEPYAVLLLGRDGGAKVYERH